MNPYTDPIRWLTQSLYSDPVVQQREERKNDDDPANKRAQIYLEASFAANIPSFPLDNDPFVQAANYKGMIYLCIQHFFKVFQNVEVGLEKKRSGVKGKTQGGNEKTDQEFVPVDDHPFLDVLHAPNPADTFVDFVCQAIMNYNLHGRLLVWGVSNSVGAPQRMYVLPTPLCTPAYNIGSPRYPLGAWRIQQYYPTTGLSGIIPTGLAGSAGAIIDAREIYELKNPHPIYRWSPFSPLVGGNVQCDLFEMIDRSFWAIMNQGIRPKGILDLPGADDQTVTMVQAKLNNEHAGPDNHGKQLVIGGGDPDRPGVAWQPFVDTDGTPHAEGWDRYAGFIAAIFGLDLSVLGLQRGGSFAERWASKEDAREGTYIPMCRQLAELLNRGPARKWGLSQKGVRVTVTLPKASGYEPGEMSRDMAQDNTGSVNEIRALRGLKPVKGGDVPPVVYLKLLDKKFGTTEAPPQPGQEGPPGSEVPKPGEKNPNEPESNRPKNEGGEGSLGGEGKGAPKPGATNGPPSQTKSYPDLDGLVNRIMTRRILPPENANGHANGKAH